MKSAPARSSKPAPKPAAKPSAARKPAAATAKPRTGGSSSAGSSSSTKSGSKSSGGLSKNKNGSSSFSKDPEKTSSTEESKAKDKAKSFQEKFLESWGDDESKTAKAKDDKTESSKDKKDKKAESSGDKDSKTDKPGSSQDKKKSEDSKSNESKDQKKSDSTSPEALKSQFTNQLQNLAQDNPDALDKILKQSFDQASPEQLTKLRNSAAAGRIELPKNVSFVDPAKLNGAAAAYSPENKGTVLLSNDLKSNPDELRKAFTEEAGHHLDSQFGAKDSTGDEGQIFQEGLEKGQAVSPERAAELKSQKDQGTAEINGKKSAVENRDNNQPMGPLTPEQMQKRSLDTLNGKNRDAAFKEAQSLLNQAARNGPEAMKTLMQGFDGADQHVQDFMLRGVQQLSDYAAKGGDSRKDLMRSSQGFFHHVSNAPQRLQQKIAGNPLGRVQIVGRLPHGFNAHSAQGVQAMAAQKTPTELGRYAEHMKYSKPEMTDHTSSFSDPKVGKALNGATQQVYDDLQKMPSTTKLAEKAAQSLEGTLTTDQMSSYLDQAKKTAYQGGYQGQKASRALARNVDQLSSQDVMRLRSNKQVMKAALEPGSEKREALMKEAIEGNNPALKRFLTDKFSAGSMSEDRFKSMTSEVGKEVSQRVHSALSKDPKELKGKEHLYAEYGNMLRAKEMYLSGGDHSEQVNYGQVMKRLDNVQRQLEPEVLGIQKSLSSRSSVQNQEKYLGSQDFQDRLKLADPKERAELARTEIQKLNTFNPEAAEQLAPKLEGQLGAMQAAEPSNGLALFQGQSEETQGQVVDGLVQATKNGLSVTGHSAKSYSSAVNALDSVATRQIAHILDNMSPDEIKNTGDLSKKFGAGIGDVRTQLEQLVEKGGAGADKAKKALRSLGRVQEWANKVGDVGGWGALGATLGTTSLALGGFPQNKMDAANAATSVAGILGNIDDTAKLGSTASRAVAQKLFNAGGKFDELAKLKGVAGMSNIMGKLKILGPVSDIAGGALDTYGAYQEAGKGDVHGTIGKSMSAAGGLGAGAGGVLMAAGLLSNPVGWGIIGVGTVTALAGLGYQWAFGMDEQEEFLQRVGVRRDDW
jgi:hypothetical protein